MRPAFVDGCGHAVGVLCADTERLFDEHMLAGGGRGGDEGLVLVGLGADDDAVDGGVGPDGGDVVEGGRGELVAAGAGAGGVAVPDGDGVYVGAGLQAPDEAGCVDVGAADECDVCHEEVLQRCVAAAASGCWDSGAGSGIGALSGRASVV